MSSRIKALDESVVNKIAAGEIIVGPVNALKEMMENSIDAGATSIDILVRDGGLKVLQLTDNGSGIDKNDLPILCERFTTSKLTAFEDLSSIQTYGFRGEALASISHIARVTVTTKTQSDACAWKVSYAAGKMLGEPKPTAGKDGTAILVEDLFYNVHSRLRALRSPNEELAKILDCVGRYAINAFQIGFSCKKFGDSQFALSVKANSTTRERIRAIFGRVVGENLVELNLAENPQFGVSAHGQVSNLNFVSKKAITPVLFINNRLVTCDPLRRALNQVYGSYLAKGNKPFIFLSLSIRPDLVDVNVHPTKREVRFLHDDEIVELVASRLEDALASVDTSRSFTTTSIYTPNPVSIREGLGQPHSHLINNMPVSSVTNKIKRQENKMVRIDSSQNKITNYLKTAEIHPGPSGNAFDSQLGQAVSVNLSPDSTTQTQEIESNDSVANARDPVYSVLRSEWSDVNLASVKTLRKMVDDDTSKELTNAFANLTYVGVVDEQRRLATIQHELRLYLVDYGSICYNLFYQIGLTDFANFGKIYLELEASLSADKGIVIQDLLIQTLNPGGNLVASLLQKIWDMKEMLDEYFSIEIHGNSNDLRSIRIASVPLLLKGYMPPLSKLPYFLYRLGNKVDWSDEMPCLHGILQQIALLYVPEVIERIDPEDESVESEERAAYVAKVDLMTATLEQTIFPCIKKRLLVPKSLKSSVIEVANLPGLYKVFERC
ncbi:LAME_0E04852g1_1 [Lachancea meyersii CBS 8951]|uniref:LAME_0E04852g1_1 n=1 Tax=Lachancea meyersii CBS 8951 TaxID=1266667 RepID=A0A1G4JH22_9SACH|nr:LAME_0E04852g1_1 [Lachancea meyersii CBS 8951]